MSILSLLGQMITEETVVLDATSKGINVALHPFCDDDSSCEGCTKCGTSPKKITTFFVPTQNSQSFSKGASVHIKHFSPHKLVSVFLVFGLPVLCILVTVFLWYFFNESEAESGFAVLTVLFSGIFGFCINAVIELIFRTVYPPHIISDHAK